MKQQIHVLKLKSTYAVVHMELLVISRLKIQQHYRVCQQQIAFETFKLLATRYSLLRIFVCLIVVTLLTICCFDLLSSRFDAIVVRSRTRLAELARMSTYLFTTSDHNVYSYMCSLASDHLRSFFFE